MQLGGSSGGVALIGQDHAGVRACVVGAKSEGMGARCRAGSVAARDDPRHRRQRHQPQHRGRPGAPVRLPRHRRLPAHHLRLHWQPRGA